MTRYTIIILSISGGILTGLAWTNWCSGLILLVSLVPFLIVENHLFKNHQHYSSSSLFIYLLPGFIITGMITLSWIRAVSIVAAICVVLTVAFLFAFTIWLAHIIRLRAGTLAGSVSLITFWLSLELACLRFQILSPWLNLGNGLAKDILFIQWYEITGAPGGSLWILLSNIFLSSLIIKLAGRSANRFAPVIVWLSILIIPSTLSVIRYSTLKPSVREKSEAIIVQPNFDPYGEKFLIPFNDQLSKVLTMAEMAVSPETDWIVLPETTIDDPVDESNLQNNSYIRMIKEFNDRHPRVNFVAGMASFTAKGDKSPSDPVFTHEYFNSALKIDTGPVIRIYHKSKLVPGFETHFSDGPLKILAKLLPELGGSNRGYKTQKERTSFALNDSSVRIAPVICYESVYGGFVTDFVRKGAEAIFVITNDGWWKGTNGYNQHFSYSCLRAIETRRPVIRSANTGISAFIDLRGKVVQRSSWWIPTILEGSFVPESGITTYVRSGDYILYLAGIASTLILLTVFVFIPLRDKMR